MGILATVLWPIPPMGQQLETRAFCAASLQAAEWVTVSEMKPNRSDMLGPQSFLRLRAPLLKFKH